MTQRKIGAHVSAAGGTDKAITRANEIGANCVQLFSGSPRVWKRTPFAEIEFEKVFSKQRKFEVKPIFIHSIYLVNLCSEKTELLQKSRAVVEYDLQFCSKVRGAGVVVHLGSHQGRGWDAVKDELAQVLQEILSNTPQDSTLLIENAAGQNGKLCGDLAEIRWLLDAVGSDRLGWCFDTCHAWAAGYSLGEQLPNNAEVGSSAKNHNSANLAKLAKPAKSFSPKLAHQEISRLELWGTLKCVHVNDSRDPFGSGRDRHENLLDGMISAQDFEWFLSRPELEQIPLILEVPGIDGNGPDAENIQRLKKMVE